MMARRGDLQKPRQGASTVSTVSRPILEGYRVLDLSQYLAGAGITRLLAELGPEIIKIELAPNGDPSRLLQWVKDGRSSVFIQNNRGKRSLCLNWDTPEGMRILRELVPRCDVVVENFANGVLERRGLHYEALRELNPGLIMVSVSAYGQTGPWADRPGFDGIIQATSGVMAMTGDAEGPPMPVGFAVADNSTAVHGFAALGYALLHKERTGEGQHIDIAMADVMFGLQDQMAQYELSGREWQPTRYSRHHPMYCPVGIFDLPDGNFGYLLVLDRQWANLCRAMEREDLTEDPRYASNFDRAQHQSELVALVQAWLLSMPSNEAVVAACLKHRVPLGEVFDATRAVGHPHFEARDMVRRVPDPVLGEVTVAGYPFKFSAQPDLPDIYAPMLGQHNHEVLTGVLGYDSATVAELEATGVLQHADR
jgi:crotonobetainyl-CoA:carnitine CoA-transferase CaiB-like acyl-CoA transferase